MADISAWSPIDESNTSAPPDGWPEFMQHSMVNNSARAMMGAVRRWYDQVLDGSLHLPYVSSAGGGMTGGLTVNSLAGISTTGGITASGAILGGSLSSLGAASISGTVTAGDLGTTGTLNVQGTATIAGSVTTGALQATSLSSLGAIGATGTVTAGGLVSTGNISASNDILVGNNASIPGTATVGALVSTGDIGAAGTLTGAIISSSGAINAAGAVNAAQYNIARPDPATSVGSSTSIYDGSGAPNIVLDSGGNNFYRAVAHSIMNRPATISYAVFNGTGTYNASGSWLVISDDAVKTDVQPYSAGLAELRQFNVVSFVYSAGAAFRDDAGTTRYGLMASEVAPIVPEMVGQAELDVDGVPSPTQTLMPGHATWLLINAVKELAARVEALEGAP